MSLIISRSYRKLEKRKIQLLSTRQKTTSSPEIKYLGMLNRGYRELIIKKIEAQQHTETKSAELIKKIGSEITKEMRRKLFDLRSWYFDNYKRKKKDTNNNYKKSTK